MEIIAKTRMGGCLIEASAGEVTAILTAVSGKSPEKLEIGQRIPAIDYASTINKIKALGDNFAFTALVERTARFSTEIEELKRSVREASEITI